MPWRTVSMSEERMRFVIQASEAGIRMTEVCRAAGISRQAGYKWLRRYQQGGAAAVLTEQSRRPHTIPNQAPPAVVEALKAVRQEKPDWGVRKLAYLLEKRSPDLPKVSRSTLQRILNREGLIDDRDRQSIACQRFERSEPNELWQMDFKGPPGFNQGIGPLSIQDDHSRYLLALQKVPTNDTASVKSALEATFLESGMPEWLLMDHGTPWYDCMGPWGWTELTVWILRQGVRITFSRFCHPQTQGKVERMHGALQRALWKRHGRADQQAWLDAFRQEYNHERLHEGIGMALPASRWIKSPRTYQPVTADWTYPPEWQTVRLAGQGQFSHHGRRWEVSRALRRQLVGLQSSDRRIWVYYCNMPLREIDLERRTNTPLPGNPFRLLPC